MKLTDTFNEAIQHADRLVRLYDCLLTRNQRRARPEWAKRFFEARLVRWPRSTGLWRSTSGDLIIVGRGGTGLSHDTFSSDSLVVLLRAALVLAMASVDKILHEAVSQEFVSLVKRGKLDKLVQLEVSKAYQIAMATRKRHGPGGNIRLRPGPKIKTEVLDKTYRDSYLSLGRLQEICAACGNRNIFTAFSRARSPRVSPSNLQTRWSGLYHRRNQIAHECDIVRKRKARMVHLQNISAPVMKQDIEFVKEFGRFLANRLG